MDWSVPPRCSGGKIIPPPVTEGIRDAAWEGCAVRHEIRVLANFPEVRFETRGFATHLSMRTENGAAPGNFAPTLRPHPEEGAQRPSRRMAADSRARPRPSRRLAAL